MTFREAAASFCFLEVNINSLWQAFSEEGHFKIKIKNQISNVNDI